MTEIELRAEILRLRSAVAFARSVIKSSESWTSECERILTAQPLDPSPVWMKGGAFCDCGAIEFKVPGMPVVRFHCGNDVVIQHTPTECRTARPEELENLLP